MTISDLPVSSPPRRVPRRVPGPLTELMVPRSRFKAHAEQVLLAVIILVPLAALVAAIPLLWGRWISWRDVVLMVVLYAITGHGVTVGFHRYLTHGAFKAKRALRVALAVAGSMAVEGPVIRWVADHRRHHAYSDDEGDPHSPWKYGARLRSAAQGDVPRSHRMAVRHRADRPAAFRP